MDYSDYEPLPVREDELPLLAREVAGEYWRFMATGLMLFEDAEKTMNPILRDVIVQAFNMAARSLVDFFGKPLPTGRRFGDDVVALHFAAEWDSGLHGHTDLVWLQTALTPGIHKRTAHLTAYRVRVPAEWDAQPIFEIGSSMSSLMARFLCLLPDERREWFRLNGKLPDVGWVYESAIGMDVDGGSLDLLLGTSMASRSLQSFYDL